MGRASDDGFALNDSFLRWRLAELIEAGRMDVQGDLAVHGVAKAAKVRRVDRGPSADPSGPLTGRI
jgi:hypothetical protein